ncbi:hypothetical protein [Enterobacter hormaechei]|uniref:hypothetical protein n=1 Tax=Enterobacter hormaechei TaxID=158836 RepID=UPI001362B120|nr:hypothetical protein [Enterobacter hormaechei]QHI59248.1 hypothetical protein GTQ93_18135 [Enterobacter hormaechei]
MSNQNIEFISLDNIHLDIENPRLPSSMRKSKPKKEDIVNWMLNDASIIELMLAIGQAGFFIGEALLVVPHPKKPEHYIVVEGNRRLTSVILLNEPEIATSQKLKIEKVLQETDQKPSEIPCIIFDNRDKINKYLGYRHITGVKSWGLLPKARYLNELAKDLNDDDFNSKCRKLAKSIGSRSDYVKSLLTAFQLYLMIEDESFFKIKGLDETTLHFNYLSDSLGKENIRDYINVDLKSNNPTSEVKITQLELLTKWYFEKNENGRSRVLGDSANLKMLDKVLGDARAEEYFRNGMGTITEAFNLVAVNADSFNQEIEQALAGLRRANNTIHNVDKHLDSTRLKLKEIFTIAKNMNTIIINMSEDQWDD